MPPYIISPWPFWPSPILLLLNLREISLTHKFKAHYYQLLPLLVQLLIVGGNVAEPDVAGEEDLLVPALVEGDQVADVAVTHVRLLRQHPRDEDVVHAEDSLVAVLEDLQQLVADEVAHDVDHAPAVGREELVRPLVIWDHLNAEWSLTLVCFNTILVSVTHPFIYPGSSFLTDDSLGFG